MLNDFIRKLRIKSGDDESKILEIWNEITKTDVLSEIKKQKRRDKNRFMEWMEEDAPCSVCGVELKRKDMYRYGDDGFNFVSYKIDVGGIIYNYQKESCYKCQDEYIKQHTGTCLDCGCDIFIGHYRQIVFCKDCAATRVYAKEINQHNARAKNNNLLGTLTNREWIETLVHFDYKCVYCGDVFQALDHYIPIRRGGGTTADNCVPACSKCNSRKGKKMPREFTTNEIANSIESYLAGRR